MEHALSGITFDNLNEAALVLDEAGYVLDKIINNGIMYVVTPKEYSSDHPLVLRTQVPQCVAVLFGGTDLAFRNGHHPAVRKHHRIIESIVRPNS